MSESWASSPAVRKSMQANRSRDTKPEMAVRRALHARGLRYFVDRRPLPELRRTADVLFPRAKIAVFVDGCYWHGCPAHHRAPVANSGYWSEKVRRNRERDLETSAVLVAAGWTVLRFWSHEDPVDVAEAIQRALPTRRKSED